MSDNNIHRTRQFQFLAHLSLAVGLLVAFAIWFWPSNLDQASPISQSQECEQLVSISASQSEPFSTKPIEKINVGDRVLAHNPEISDEERASWKEPDLEQMAAAFFGDAKRGRQRTAHRAIAR